MKQQPHSNDGSLS